MGKKIEQGVTVFLVVDGSLDITPVGVPKVTEKCVCFEIPNGTGELVRVHKHAAGKHYFDTKAEAAEYVAVSVDEAIAETQERLAELQGMRESLQADMADAAA